MCRVNWSRVHKHSAVQINATGYDIKDKRKDHHYDIQDTDKYRVICYYNLGGSWTIGYPTLEDTRKIVRYWTGHFKTLGIKIIMLQDRIQLKQSTIFQK